MTEPLHHTLIKSFETLRLTAYICPAGTPTIGWGHTGFDVTFEDVKAGKTITRAEAQALFDTDIARFENGVKNSLKLQATEQQFGAMVSLAFNIGMVNWLDSTLRKAFNLKLTGMAVVEFHKWNKGRVKGVLTALPGLTRRRAAEEYLFVHGFLPPL